MEGNRHQLRDDLILEAHSAARNIFVTEDAKGFIKNGPRGQLEALLGTRMRSHSEFESQLGVAFKSPINPQRLTGSNPMRKP